MPIDRLTLAQPISSRSPSFGQDAVSCNVYFEKKSQNEIDIIKRPGLITKVVLPSVSAIAGYAISGYAIAGSPFSSTIAQGLFSFNGYLWTVINSTLYQINTSTWAKTSFGTVSTTNPVSFAKTANDAYMFLHDGVNGYYLPKAGVSITTLGAPFPSGSLAYGAAYLDGYIFVMTTTGRIYNSGIEDPTSWNALNYASSSYEPDSGAALFKQFNYLVAFNQWTTEVFYDAANPTGSPLLANQSAVMELGCPNGLSAVAIEQTLIFVGQALDRGRSVYILDGLSPKKVSNPWVDRFLDNDAFTTVRAQAYKINGHIFYILTLPDSNITLVYDLSEQQWYKWSSYYNGVESYYKPMGFCTINNKWYTQDPSGIYEVSSSTYVDGSNSIPVTIISGLQDSGTVKRKFYRSLDIVGDKVSGNITVYHTDDDYNTWSSGRTINLNSGRSVIHALGSARRRAWKFYTIDNIPLRLSSAEIDFDLGRMEGQN